MSLMITYLTLCNLLLKEAMMIGDKIMFTVILVTRSLSSEGTLMSLR